MYSITGFKSVVQYITTLDDAHEAGQEAPHLKLHRFEDLGIASSAVFLIYVDTYMNIYMYIYTHTYIYIDIYIYTHTLIGLKTTASLARLSS